MNDLLFSFRMIGKMPAFTCIAVLMLAIGIGANTAIFSLVYAVLLRPLPFREADRIVVLNGVVPWELVSAPKPHYQMLDWTEQTNTLEQVTAYESSEVNLADGGETQRVLLTEVTGNFFALFGVNPLLGRVVVTDDIRGGNANVVVVSEDLWRHHYGSSRDVIGRIVNLNGIPFTVVGVMPSIFSFPRETQIWVPSSPTSLELLTEEASISNVVARLRRRMSIPQSRAELASIIPQRGQGTFTSQIASIRMVPLHTDLVGDRRYILWLLFGAVGLVLLISCGNVAGLQLARGIERQRELAIRAALGATRWMIIQQLITESVVLSILGGALGTLLSVWAMHAARPLFDTRVPFANDVRVNVPVLGFTLAVCLIASLLSGLLPAFRSSKTNINQALRGGAGATGADTTLTRRRLGNLLMISMVALSLLLSVGAGLLLRTLSHVISRDLGFHPENTVVTKVSLAEPRYSSSDQLTVFYGQILDHVRQSPGELSMGIVNNLPFGKSGGMLFGFVSENGRSSVTPIKALYLTASPDYFRALEIPLIQGRYFEEQDRKGAPKVAIINVAMAQQAWGEENAIGKRLRSAQVSSAWYEVIGVVGNSYRSTMTSTPSPEVYFSIFQRPANSVFLVARGPTNTPTLVSTIRSALWATDKSEPISDCRTMKDLISDSISGLRFRTVLLGIFAMLATLLAVVGVFGVTSRLVNQRTHEIGIRMALGAGRRDVLKLIVTQGMGPAFVGSAIGVVAALGSNRLLSRFLYGVQPTDFVSFIGAAAFLIVASFIAAVIPAYRATKVDPIAALRQD